MAAVDSALNPIADLLLSCGRETLSPAAATELRAAAKRLTAAQWRTLCETARRERMGPLVFRHLAEANLLPALDPEAVNELKHEYAVSLVASRVLWRELRAILGALAARECAVVPLKGVSLALRAYSEPALRPGGDTDLLILPRAIDEFAEALRSLGYTPQLGSERLTSRDTLHFQVSVFTKTGKPPIEAHTALARAPSYRRCLPVSDVLRRSQPVTVEGVTMLRLHPYDELLHLCLHLTAQHYFDRLIWLVDIAQLLGKLPSDWNWDGFTHDIIRRGGATPVGLALERAHAQLGAEIPADVLHRLHIASQSARERAAWHLAHVAFANPRRVGLHMLSLSTFPQKLAFTREIVATGLNQLFPVARLRHTAPAWRDDRVLDPAPQASSSRDDHVQ